MAKTARKFILLTKHDYDDEKIIIPTDSIRYISDDRTKTLIDLLYPIGYDNKNFVFVKESSEKIYAMMYDEEMEEGAEE